MKDASFTRVVGKERIKQVTCDEDHISCPTHHLGGKPSPSKKEAGRYKNLYRLPKYESSDP